MFDRTSNRGESSFIVFLASSLIYFSSISENTQPSAITFSPRLYLYNLVSINEGKKKRFRIKSLRHEKSSPIVALIDQM